MPAARQGFFFNGALEYNMDLILTMALGGPQIVYQISGLTSVSAKNTEKSFLIYLRREVALIADNLVF